MRLQRPLETAKTPASPSVPLAELVSSASPAPCADKVMQTRVASQGPCSSPQCPSQVLGSVSRYLKSVTGLLFLTSNRWLVTQRIQATLSKHFWQAHPFSARPVEGTPLARCAEKLHVLHAPGQRVGHAVRIWPQKQPQQRILGYSSPDGTWQRQSVLMAAGLSH